MSAHRLTCPTCKKLLQISDPHAAGKTFRCPSCTTTLRVPGTPPKSPQPQPTPATIQATPARPVPVKAAPSAIAAVLAPRGTPLPWKLLLIGAVALGALVVVGGVAVLAAVVVPRLVASATSPDVAATVPAEGKSDKPDPQRPEQRPEPEPRPEPVAATPKPQPDSPPGEVKEQTILKGPAGPVHWLRLSGDGSRLVSAGHGVVWDVPGQRQLFDCKPPAGVGTFWLSADGRTLLAAHGGRFRVLDAAAGNEVFTAPTLPYGSNYTAVDLSPDGAYLALASNEWSGKSRGTIRPYTGGNLTIWDVRSGKEKWRLPGIAEEVVASLENDPVLKGHIRQIAFSPDATRLATLGPEVRVFTVGKETPTAAAPALRDGRGELLWPADGKGLILREARDFFRIDPTTAQVTGNFTLAYPRPPAPKPTGNRLPLPEPPDSEPPQGWHEHQITLSADGSRLAAHIIREHEKAKIRNNAVVLWDVASRRRVGVQPLPDDTYNPGTKVMTQMFAPPILFYTGRGSDIRIALSGDGKRLAVADAAGTVTVYGTAQIEARTRESDPKPPPITDGFTVGSVWTRVNAPRGKLQLPPLPWRMQIMEREGETFKAELTFDDNTAGRARGRVDGGEVHFDAVEATRGAFRKPPAAKLKGDTIEWTFTGPVFPRGSVTEVVKMTRSAEK